MQGACGLTSDQVMRYRLFLCEYGPEIIYIKYIHDKVVDAITRLEYNPKLNPSKDNQEKLVMFNH